MAEETIETLDSTNEETDIEGETKDSPDVDALKEQNAQLVEKNRKLFARAKKAEGFSLKDGEWTKEVTKEELADVAILVKVALSSLTPPSINPGTAVP